MDDLKENQFRCLYCQATNAKPWLLDCRDIYMGIGPPVDYVACTTCHAVQQQPIPKDPSGFYRDYPIHKPKSTLHRMMSKLINRSMFYNVTNLSPGMILLDYGCGDGEFLRLAAQAGATVFGFEPNASHADIIYRRTGVKVFSDETELRRELRGKCHVMTLHMVLEHLVDIDKTFATATELIRPSGILHITIPNALSWEAKLFGAKWHCLDAPRHISLAQPASLFALAKRFDFQIENISHVPFANGVAASLASLFGVYRFFLFLFFLPIGLITSRLAPSGTYAVKVRKDASSNVNTPPSPWTK